MTEEEIKNHFNANKIKEEQKNHTLNHLNNFLFDQLAKLNTDDEEKLGLEIRRTYAIASIAEQITNNANTQLKAIKMMNDVGVEVSKQDIPQIIGNK